MTFSLTGTTGTARTRSAWTGTRSVARYAGGAVRGHLPRGGRPGRAPAVRDFVEDAVAQDGVRLMSRIDVAQFWTMAFPPASALQVVLAAGHPDHGLAVQEPPDVLGRHAHPDV